MRFTGLLSLRSRLLALHPREGTFARRGFPPGSDARDRLEAAAAAFIGGYNAALSATSISGLHRTLGDVSPPLAGFAYEGAAMASVLVDALSVRSDRRFHALREGPGRAHVYLAFVGAGWACARLPWPLRPDMRRVDPLLGWLAIDGWGFQEGFFRWRRYADGRSAPLALSGYARCAFDQGLGRSLWFVHGARVDEISVALEQFSASRRPHLWSGVGLAATYAGGADARALSRLSALAGEWLPHVRQGSAFACAARARADNLTAEAEEACVSLCGIPAAAAAAIVEDASHDLFETDERPAYELWRTRIRRALAAGTGAAALREVC